MKRLLGTFLIIGSFSCLNAQTVLTIGEVFDFETGDEFHLKNEIWQVVGQGQRITITGKWFTPNSDTVFYGREIDSYLVTPNGPMLPFNYYFSTTTDTIFYTHLDSLITTYNDWLTGDSGMVANGWYHSWFRTDSLLCNLEINGWKLGPVPLDFPGYGATFGRGVGQTWDYYIDEMDVVTSNWRLRYYKKGAFTCGTPDLTTAALTEQQERPVMVFPSPFTDDLTFRFPDNKIHTISIADLNGRTVLQTEVTNGQTITTGHLPAGVFLVQSETGSMIARICK